MAKRKVVGSGTKIGFTISNDNRSKVLAIERETLEDILWVWGALAQGYAQEKCPVDTSNLVNSIDYDVIVKDMEMQVGTNVEYAPYVEFGTGIYATGEGGSAAKKIPWVYKDDEGKWHRTSGMKAQPFLRPAIENHIDEYKDILKEYLSREI